MKTQSVREKNSLLIEDMGLYKKILNACHEFGANTSVLGLNFGFF